MRWVDPAAPWLGEVGGDPVDGTMLRAGGRRPRRPALRRDEGRPRPRRRSTRRCSSRWPTHVDVDPRRRRRLRRSRPARRAAAGRRLPPDRARRSTRPRSGPASSANSIDHLARSRAMELPVNADAQAVRPARRERRGLRDFAAAGRRRASRRRASPSSRDKYETKATTLRDRIEAAADAGPGRSETSRRAAVARRAAVDGRLDPRRAARRPPVPRRDARPARPRRRALRSHVGRRRTRSRRRENKVGAAAARSSRTWRPSWRGAHRDRRPLDGAGEERRDAGRLARAHGREGDPADAGLAPGLTFAPGAGGGTRTLTGGALNAVPLPIGLRRPVRRRDYGLAPRGRPTPHGQASRPGRRGDVLHLSSRPLRGTLGGRWRCTICRRRRW